MSKYLKLIEWNGWWAESQRSNNSDDPLWDSKEIAEKYLEKYSLSEDEYDKKWKPIQDSIFINQNEGLPQLLYSDKYKIMALRGGRLLADDYFMALQECLRGIKGDHFVIIQNDYGQKGDAPVFKMKYPKNISWEELTSGKFISDAILHGLYNEYFIFDESGSWGYYGASEYQAPLEILGFKAELADIFREKFKVSVEERNEITEKWLPPNYKDKVVW